MLREANHTILALPSCHDARCPNVFEIQNGACYLNLMFASVQHGFHLGYDARDCMSAIYKTTDIQVLLSERLVSRFGQNDSCNYNYSRIVNWTDELSWNHNDW